MPKPAYPRDSGYLRWRATNSKKPSPRWRGLGDAPAGPAGEGAGRRVDDTTETPAAPRDSGYLRWRATNSKKPSPRWRGLGDAPAGPAGKGAGRSVDYTTEPPHLRHVCGTFGPHPRFSLRCRPVILPLIPPMGTA